MFRKVLFLWSSMPSFSFIGYTLTKLFRKPDNWRQIYKQTSSTFYTSNDVSRRKNCYYVTTRLKNSYSCLITFLEKIQKQPPEEFFKKMCPSKFCKLHKKTPVLETFFNKVAAIHPASFLKRVSSTSAFLWSLRNF